MAAARRPARCAEEIAEPTLIAEDIEGLVCGYHLAIARPIDGIYTGPSSHKLCGIKAFEGSSVA